MNIKEFNPSLKIYMQLIAYINFDSAIFVRSLIHKFFIFTFD